MLTADSRDIANFNDQKHNQPAVKIRPVDCKIVTEVLLDNGLELELPDKTAIVARSQPLVRHVIDILTEEPHRPIAQQEMRPACVTGLETHRRDPAGPVVTSVRRVTWGVGAGVEIDRGRSCDPMRVGMRPTIRLMI